MKWVTKLQASNANFFCFSPWMQIVRALVSRLAACKNVCIFISLLMWWNRFSKLKWILLGRMRSNGAAVITEINKIELNGVKRFLWKNFLRLREHSPANFRSLHRCVDICERLNGKFPFSFCFLSQNCRTVTPRCVSGLWARHKFLYVPNISQTHSSDIMERFPCASPRVVFPSQINNHSCLSAHRKMCCRRGPRRKSNGKKNLFFRQQTFANLIRFEPCVCN